jgi:photosystem II PsbH protein
VKPEKFFRIALGTLLRPLNSEYGKVVPVGDNSLNGCFRALCCILVILLEIFNGSVILEDVTMSWQTLAK